MRGEIEDNEGKTKGIERKNRFMRGEIRKMRGKQDKEENRFIREKIRTK